MKGLGPHKPGGGSVQLDNDFDIDSENGLTNKRLTEFRNSIAPAPNYIQPVVSLTASTTGNVEVGTELAVSLAIGFNQNDAGSPTGFVINKNGNQLANGASAFTHIDNIVVSRSTISYQGVVSFLDGVIKNNPEFGFPDDRGRILAGSRTSPTRSIVGRYRIFFGATASIPSTSTQLRALPNNGFENANSVTIQTGTTNRRFVVAVPTVKTTAPSLSAQDTTNNVPYTYALADVFNLVLPNGDNQEYRIYALELDNAYPSNATHIISL